MTSVQRDVWVTCQLSAGASAAYNISTTLRLVGDLDVQALQEAVRLLVLRHEALRTTFDSDGGRRIVHDSSGLELRSIDVSDLPEAERASRVAELVDSDLSTPYELASGPLHRLVLVRSGADEYTLLVSAHHLVCDGWSFGVLLRDLGAIYSARVLAEPVDLDSPTQYGDYAEWRAEEAEFCEPHWLGLYDTPPTELDLPPDLARPLVRSYSYSGQRAIIDTQLANELRELAASEGVTLFVVLLSAWEILLHRLSGQLEFTNGVFVAGQTSMGVRDLVGLCANLLPLRVAVDPAGSLTEHLQRVRRSMFDGLDNQDYSVGELASRLNLPRDPSRPAVVSTAVTFETPAAGVAFEGLHAVHAEHGRRTFGAYDFEAYLSEGEDDLKVDFQYATDVFESDTIERWLRYYVRLLRQMAGTPSVAISDLSLLDRAEREQILHRWNDTNAPVPDTSVREMIEQRAAEHPDRVAIKTTDGSISYGELDARANRLARYLMQVGLKKEQVAGVHLDRSPEAIVALLAVHKAGGAYVPLDPQFPSERLAMVAQDTGIHVHITSDSLADDLSVDGAVVVSVDRDATTISEFDDSALGTVSAPADLAYVISTSGSTGRPKGVEITQSSLTNQLLAMLEEPGLEPDDVLLAVTTLSFDPALMEIYLPLMIGATIVMAGSTEAGDAEWLRDRLAARDITVMQATPTTWQMLLDAGWTGTPGLRALSGGEALSPELAAAVASRVDTLWNVYGTTETTIWSSSSRVDPDADLIPIGGPIANTRFHVLDGRREPQPPGVIGELYIGGAGLARGYRNQPELTDERFIEHQFDGEAPQRLYRTGDLARRLPDGRIEFLGRDDLQVKIRGHRIELGEIEVALQRHPGVRDSVVVARVAADGTKRLVGYIVPTDDRHDSVSELRVYLRSSLPEYMVPSSFVSLDSLPLLPNRKVDRSRLPGPDSDRPDLATALVRPRNVTEATLAAIWARLLDVKEVGVDDNFFDLGGDSLTGLRAMIEANRLGIALAASSIFQYQTIGELALAAGAGTSTAGDQGTVVGPMPLTPAQIRFLKERDTPDAHHWNLSTLVSSKRLSQAALRVVVQAIIKHHDSLRLRISNEGGHWRQAIAELPESIPFASYDLSRSSPEERKNAIERVCTELQGSFRLDEGVMLRVAHFDMGPEDGDRLFATIHHFAVDGLTWEVFWEDFEQAYRQAEAGAQVTFPPKTTSILEWATQLERLARTPRIADTTRAWLALPWHEVARVPMDFAADPTANTNDSTAVVEVDLDQAQTARLLGGRARPEQLIIASLARSLSKWTASQTVLIDVLGHGRDAVLDAVNMSRTVGFTLSYNPVVLTHPTWDASAETLQAVSDHIDSAPEGFSFELLRFLSPDKAVRDRLTELPRAELLFNYRGSVSERDVDARWEEATESYGPADSPRGRRQYPLAVRATLEPNLRLSFVYSTSLHAATTIEHVAEQVAETMRRLLD